jgi:uridine kinase
MKVALLIAGYLRNYKENIDFIKTEILNKFEHVDVYLHITKNESSEDKYLNQISDCDIEEITQKLKPFSVIIENNILYSDNKRTNNTLNHWSKLYKLNQIKKINERSLGEKYDLVIRYRPDLSIKSKNFFTLNTDEFILIPNDSKIDKNKLININDNYICDAIAYGNSENMDKYFDIHIHINSLIEKYGYVSETILFEYLTTYNINYKLVDIDYSFILSKCNVFAICGDSGSGKSTLSNLLMNTFTDSFKLECDRYHKWERNNENWNKITHLNPNANFITKMKEDIFNLKIGNDIYQVDYDHHTGKFTEKQLINPSNNLIVCGLHSLYHDPILDSDMLYDLKIYMDTDDKLKNKWKIMRDVKERGYSIDKVLTSIEKRKSDFKEFIEPQKNNADLIIRFFTNDEIDFNDLYQDINVNLEVSIRSDINISNILNSLTNYGINYTIDNLINFNKITFVEYKKIDNLNNGCIPIINNLYDYILFIILNIN